VHQRRRLRAGGVRLVDLQREQLRRLLRGEHLHIGGIGGCNTGVTWPGGYCSDSCLFLNCHGNDVCHDHFCYQPCSPAMQGQASCRAGYVCDSREDDGGVGVQGRCLPDCRAPGLGCGTGYTCSPLGYCN
jgi:hypothetical protein